MSEENTTDSALAAERQAASEKLTQKQNELEAAHADDASDDAAIANLTKERDAALARVKELENAADPTPAENKRQSLSAVQVFPHRNDMPEYVDYPKVFAALDELQVKRIRGQLGPGTSDKAKGFYKTAYADYGIQCLLTIGEPRQPINVDDMRQIELDLGALGDAVDSIYGWNEPNSVRGGGTLPINWAAMTVAHQKQIAAVGGRLGIPVGTAALWSGRPAATWEDMVKIKSAGQTKDHYDIIAYHQYPRDNDTQAEIDAFYSRTETELRRVLNDTDSPFACTEWGYSTAPNAGTSGAVRLSEAERARRVPMVAKYHTDHGNRHSMFELWNSVDPSGADREKWLGVVWVKGERTPAFKAYKDFLASQ